MRNLEFRGQEFRGQEFRGQTVSWTESAGIDRGDAGQGNAGGNAGQPGSEPNATVSDRYSDALS